MSENRVELIVSAVLGSVAGICALLSAFFAWRMWVMAKERRKGGVAESELGLLRPVDLVAIRMLDSLRITLRA